MPCVYTAPAERLKQRGLSRIVLPADDVEAFTQTYISGVNKALVVADAKS